jgi:hypothetical protein
MSDGFHNGFKTKLKGTVSGDFSSSFFVKEIPPAQLTCLESILNFAEYLWVFLFVINFPSIFTVTLGSIFGFHRLGIFLI